MEWDTARHGPPCQKIPQAVKTTGLSAYYLRQGVKDGTVPHVRSGKCIYILVPELLDKLQKESAV